MGEIEGFEAPIIGTSTAFARFVSLCLSPFPNLKKYLVLKRFGYNEKVKAAVKGYFENLPNGIHALEKL